MLTATVLLAGPERDGLPDRASGAIRSLLVWGIVLGSTRAAAGRIDRDYRQDVGTGRVVKLARE